MICPGREKRQGWGNGGDTICVFVHLVVRIGLWDMDHRLRV